MLSSFADLVALSPHPYTRPVLCPGGPLVVKAGRHPVVSTLPLQQLASSFVANDLFLSPLENVHIITGPNGAGKVSLSIYLSTHFIDLVSSFVCFFLLADGVHQTDGAHCGAGADRLLCACKTRHRVRARPHPFQTRYAKKHGT